MVETARNFYGINKVVDGTGISGPYRELYNGAIAHGVQLMNPDLENIPTQYYGHRSGLALAIRLLREQRPVEAGLNIGVVGLGVGTIAALADEGDRVRFYEINPEVERLASRHFSFLADSPAEVEVVLGDARIVLAREAARGDHQGFDILVLDAFNSDSVPVHLLTREAYSLFRSHLRPGGVLAFHTSNRHLGLSPNVRALAAHHGDEAVRIANVREGWFRVDASRWVLTSDDPQFLTAGQLSVEATPWQDGETTDRPWSDDYSSLVDAFQLKRHAATNKWLAAPNQGLFVYDIAGLIEESQEAHMRDISRALYADTRPGVPVFVVTANTMRDRHGRPVPTGELPAQFARSIGLDQWRSHFEIVVFILLEEKRIEILVGDSWPAETRRELEARLQQTLQASLGSHSLSDTLLRMTREADRLIRSLVER